MTEKTLWTALITPMHPDGGIHFEDLETISRKQENAGNGILILGSTGEGLALGDDEKKEVVNFVSGLSLNVPVMAGVGGFNLKKQADWISFCNQKNIDAFLLVSPLYSKPGLMGQISWFQELLDRSEKSCMIYNIPSRTGIKLFPEVLEKLADHKNLWAVKEASGSIQEYQQFREAAPGIPLFSGDDALLPFFSVAGCGGLVSVASNIWPEETGLYVEKCLAGETETLFPLWTDAVKALFSASNPIPAKRLLKEKGWISSSVLRPPLTESELVSAEELTEIDEKIKNWYQNNR
jgi:4-hydroxy-tetrahydrodipicolinate synthase